MVQNADTCRYCCLSYTYNKCCHLIGQNLLNIECIQGIYEYLMRRNLYPRAENCITPIKAVLPLDLLQIWSLHVQSRHCTCNRGKSSLASDSPSLIFSFPMFFTVILRFFNVFIVILIFFKVLLSFT